MVEDFIGSQGPQRSVVLGRGGGREGGERQLCPLSPFKYLGLSCWHNGKCQNVFEDRFCKETFPVAVAVLTNNGAI